MSTSPPKPFNIAIIGGGISGLCLALGLLARQIPVTVYESAPAFGEIGAGVGFDPVAVWAMSQLDPRISAAFCHCAHVDPDPAKTGNTVWFHVRVGDMRKAGKDGVVRGKEKEGLRVGETAFCIYHTVPGPKGGVHRAQFLDELVKLIPGHVPRFGKRLVDVEYAEAGDVVLGFADGTSARHDAVIGCDGIKSRTREVLLRYEQPEAARAVFSGKYAYRGLIPMERAIEIVGEEQAKRSQMHIGYHGHVLTFPIAGGKFMNGKLPLYSGKIVSDCVVVAFSSRDTWTDPNWVVNTSREAMRADYAHWSPTVQAVIAAMQSPDIWALFYHPPARRYYKSRICLVGDAAHATTPHQGAGACFCVEDCYVLAELIGRARTLNELDDAFHAYDEVRRPRTQKLVTTSKEAARVYEFELFGDDLEAIEKNMQERMRWVWHVDLKAELERAYDIFDRRIKSKGGMSKI
jgi:salicylate hydroxylase